MVDRLAATRRVPVATALPRPAGASFARLVLEDAAGTCFALNVHTPENGALHTAVWVFVDRLVRFDARGVANRRQVDEHVTAPRPAYGASMITSSVPTR